MELEKLKLENSKLREEKEELLLKASRQIWRDSEESVTILNCFGFNSQSSGFDFPLYSNYSSVHSNGTNPYKWSNKENIWQIDIQDPKPWPIEHSILKDSSYDSASVKKRNKSCCSSERQLHRKTKKALDKALKISSILYEEVSQERTTSRNAKQGLFNLPSTRHSEKTKKPNTLKNLLVEMKRMEAIN